MYKKLLITLVSILTVPTLIYAQTVFRSSQVGTTPVANYYLKTDGINSFWAAVTGGGGGGAGTFSTTTIASRILQYPYTSLITSLDSSATTTSKWWFDPVANVTYLAGKLGIGTTTPYAPLSVVGSVMFDDMLHIDPTSDRILLFGDDSVTSQVDFMQVSPTVTTQAHNTYGQRVSFTNSNTSGHAYSDGAILGEMIIPTTNANNYTERQSGLYGLFRHYGTGRVSEGWGTYSVAGQYGAGVVDNLKAYVAHIYTDAASSGNVNNAYGVYIKRPDIVGSGDVGNSYGLFLEDHATVGTSTSFGIYQDGNDTKSVLEGKVAVGYTDPGTARLAINGYVGIGTSTPSNILHVASSGSTGQSIFNGMRIGEGTNGKFGYMDMVTNPATGNPYFYIQSIHSGTAFRDLILNPGGGNVGIGTTTPIGYLSVAGSGPGTFFRLNRTDTAAGFDIDLAGASANLNADSGFKFQINDIDRGAWTVAGFGIGTTSPSRLLQVRVPFSSNQDNGLRVSSNAGEYSFDVGLKSNALGTFRSALTMNTGASPVEALSILPSGNVGIGTTTPGSKLDVHDGSFRLSDTDIAHGFTTLTSNGSFFVAEALSGSAGGALLTGYGEAGVPAGLVLRGLLGASDPTDTIPAMQFRAGKQSGTTGGTLGAAETAYQFSDWDGGTDWMTIAGSGNVGIGTSTPDVKLNVVGSSGTSRPWTRNARTVASYENNTAVGTAISIIGNSAGYSGIYFGDNTAETQGNLRYDHATDMFKFFTDVSTERFTIAGNTGNVGVATSTPGARLSVAGTAGGTAPLLLISTSTLTYATSTVMIIDSNGRMGVGTSSPNSLLEVDGSFHVEERTLATSTSMSVDFCNQDTSNNLRMQVGSANITLTFTNFTSCVGKRISLKVFSADRGLIGSTTITASTLYWDGYTTPESSTTNGGMVEYIFDPTLGTSTPFILGAVNRTLP